MLILLIRSHCNICPLPTMTISRVCTVVNCWQWPHFIIGPNEQNQYFAELRQKICLFIHAVVLQRGFPSLEGKNEFFVGKKRKKRLPTPVRQTTVCIIFNPRAITMQHFSKCITELAKKVKHDNHFYNTRYVESSSSSMFIGCNVLLQNSYVYNIWE